jgi:hydrogenase nickel incorporation protein HypA/HybF
MHELSLAAGIVKMVEDAAARDGFSRVGQLRLEAGALAGVEVRALRFALDAISPGTCLEGATIEIEQPPGTAWCKRCNSSVEITSRADPCPLCSGYPIQPTGGCELRVLDLLVHDQET